MQIHALQAFLTLCQEGSISRACEKLNISQQGLSRQLRAMEQELGVTLFTRKSRGLTLTEEGAMLEPYFKDVCQRYEAACTALASRHEPKTIRLGFTTASAYATGLSFILNYQDRHPETVLQITTLTNDECEQQLLDGKLDAALITEPVHADSFHNILILESPACAVVNRDHPFAKRDGIRIRDLEGEIVYGASDRYRMRQLVESKFKDMLPKVKKLFSADQHLEYIKLPLEGPGVALTFYFLCDNLDPRLVCVPILDNIPTRIYFCTNKDKPGNAQLKSFAAYVKEKMEIGGGV